jgi:DNA-binding GntR family transcriptional regulator
MTVKPRRRRVGIAGNGRSPTGTTLTEDAYRLVKWRITTVQLAPGARFTEPELAVSLKLSRTPVREALLLLRRQGLVSVEGRSGYRVTPVTLRDVQDLSRVRRLLEGEAAFLAALAPSEPDELHALVARAPGVTGLGPDGVAEWIESDRRFHMAVALATGNRQLADALEPVLEKSSRFEHLALALGSPSSVVIHTHDALVAALRSRDPEGARRTVVEQIDELEKILARALASSPSVMSANVAIEKPRNEFYLDVPASDVTSAARRGSHRKPVAAPTRASTAKRTGVRT